LVYHGLRSQQIKNYFGEFFLTNEGGFRTPVSITITPVKNSQGEVSEIILSFQDISQLLSAQKEFDKRHELETIGLVAAGIAHDFNNMLTAAIGSVSVAKLDEAMEEDNKELLLDAERALINATELTHQLLTVSKGGVAVQKSGNIVDIVKETVRFVLRGTKIGIDFKVGSQLHPINFNLGQICQLFNNLVINAREAMPNGGKIIISFINTSISEESLLRISAGKYIKISVTDQGMGIPDEVLPRIFDPYFTTKPTGNGLGLASVYTIVKKHNGYIFVDSKIGKGSTFRIYLPAINE
ncbi:MAG: two-component system sensor histidine kinase NtrB, partial [Promethearchaeota archaeon]